MAGHVQLKFAMTECSKTQIRLTGLIYGIPWCYNCYGMWYFSGLPSSKLGSYLENRINTFLKKKDAGAGEVFIKVLSSTDKVVEVRPGMKAR